MSMTYGYMMEAVWHPPLFFAEQSESVSLPGELQLQALWYAGLLGRVFRGTQGQTVEVRQFGEWNRGRGPDFKRCCVVVDGVERIGAIELDLESASWELHGHGGNEDFNEVVLHVIFRQNKQQVYIQTSEGKEVVQVVVPLNIWTEAMHVPQRDIAIAHPGRCYAPMKGMGKLGVERLFEQAAQYRAGQKVKRWRLMEEVHGRDLALFYVTAESLGYQANTLAMKILAQRVPLGVLLEEGEDAEALLFGSAGFLSPLLHERAPEETKEYLRSLWDRWWKSRHRYEESGRYLIPWKGGGQRPANHPHRRVGALMAVVRRWQEYKNLALARPFDSKRLIDFFQSLEHPFWDYHYTLTSDASQRKVSIFGKSQAMEMLVNSLIPLAMAERGMTLRAYHKLRNSVVSESVKRCGIRLFGSTDAAKPWMSRMMYQQAMLQVYHDFCLEDFTECDRCPFPEQLAQWK